MLRWLADENFNGYILDAWLRESPLADIVTARSEGLMGYPDPALLAWAAEHERVLLNHDVNTIPKFAYERISQDVPVMGVFIVLSGCKIHEVVGSLMLIDSSSDTLDWNSQITYLPGKLDWLLDI